MLLIAFLTSTSTWHDFVNGTKTQISESCATKSIYCSEPLFAARAQPTLKRHYVQLLQ